MPTFSAITTSTLFEPLVRIEPSLHRLLACLGDVSGAAVVAGERKQASIGVVELRIGESGRQQPVEILRAGANVRVQIPERIQATRVTCSKPSPPRPS